MSIRLGSSALTPERWPSLSTSIITSKGCPSALPLATTADADAIESTRMVSAHPWRRSASARSSFAGGMHTAYSMSVKPAAKNCSASFRVDTVMPTAPASRCRRATSMHFVVLTWGRRRTPSAFMRCCMRAMLRIRRVSSISAAGVGMSDGCKPRPFNQGILRAPAAPGHRARARSRSARTPCGAPAARERAGRPPPPPSAVASRRRPPPPAARR